MPKGLGITPLGTTPFGHGQQDAAPVRPVATVSPFAVSPRLDPRTKQLVTRNGNPVDADGTEQRVLIRLSMDRGSSAVRQLGNRLRTITRITDNHVKQVDTVVRAAMEDMVVSGEIQILRILVERVGQTGTYVQTVWRKVGETNERSTYLGAPNYMGADEVAIPPWLLSASNVLATGGPTVVRGSDFTEDAVVYSENVARSTSYIDSTRLHATLPAHATGFVPVFVRQESGTSAVGEAQYIAGALPLPVVTSATSVTDVGGTTTVTGSNFTNPAVVWTDGVARSTTYVNATTLTAVVPAHAAGTVNLYVAQASGNSGTISLTYTASLLNPATLPLSLWVRAKDFVGAVYPAQITLPSKASAGVSGTRIAKRNDVGTLATSGGHKATENITSTGGSSPMLQFAGTSFTDHDGVIFAPTATPAGYLFSNDLYSQADGAFFSIVVSAPHSTHVIPTSGGAPYLAPQIFAGVYTGGGQLFGPCLRTTTTGYAVTISRNTAPYYNSVNATVASNTRCILQGYWNPATDEFGLRANLGAWVRRVHSVVQDGPPNTTIRNEMIGLGGFAYPDFYGDPSTFQLGELLTQGSLPSDPVADQIVQYLAAEHGVTL